MGRPRKPTSLHILQGTYDARHHAGSEPQPDGRASPLYRLGERGQQLWDNVVPQLGALGLATDLDSTQLTQLCELWEEICYWRERTADDRAKRLAHLTKAIRAFDNIACRFGMTPADRAKLRSGEQLEKANPWADWLDAVNESG